MESIIVKTIYGKVDLSATSSSVDDSCPFIPPQALHAGATELDRVKKDPNCIDTREDVLKALEAAKNILISSNEIDSSQNKKQTSSPTSTSSLDEFEGVSLKLLGTRYQQLLSINGRMQKQIEVMHRDAKRAVEPFLETAEEAENLKHDELLPTLQRVSALKRYCAQSVAIVGLARRRQNLKRLEAMLQIAGNWASKVTTVKESLKDLSFVKALNTVGSGSASFVVDGRSGVLKPETELSSKTSYLLDRREICSLFEQSMNNVRLEKEQEDDEDEEDDEEEEDHDIDNDGDRTKDQEEFDRDPSSLGQFTQNSTQPAFNNNNIGDAPSPSVSSSAPTTAPNFNNQNNNMNPVHSQSSLSMQGSAATYHSDPHSMSNITNSNIDSPTTTNSRLTKKQKRQLKKEERLQQRIEADDVFVTFLGKMSFRRWQHLCEPSNPFILDVIRRSFCCALATGWRGIRKMDEKRIAQEKLFAQIQATQDRMEREEAELDALMMADNNNKNINDTATPSKTLSASYSPAASSTSNKQPKQEKKMRKKKKTTAMTTTKTAPVKKATKTDLDWSSSSDDDNNLKQQRNNDIESDQATEYETDTDVSSNSSSMMNRNDNNEEIQTKPIKESSLDFDAEDDFDTTKQNDGDDFNESFAASSPSSPSSTTNNNNQHKKERLLYESLFSTDQRFWNSPSSPKEIKSCYDTVIAVHSALVVMQCDGKAIAEFVKECFAMMTEHVLNYTFDDAFGEERDSWKAVIETLVPSEMERAILRFCECLCAFVNRAVVVAEIFVDQTLKMQSAEMMMTMNGTKNDNKNGESDNDNDDEGEKSPSSSSKLPSAGFGLNSTVIINALFEIVDKHVNAFCSGVPWTRTSLAEATTHFQTLRVVICSVLPNVVMEPSESSENNNNKSNKNDFLKKAIKQAIREDVLRSLDYRITKAISKFSEKSMEEVTQLMKSEMFSAFAATTEDFPDTVRPLVMSTEERIRMWGEEQEAEMMALRKSRSMNSNSSAANSPIKSSSSFGMSDELHTPSHRRRQHQKNNNNNLKKREPTAKDFNLAATGVSSNDSNDLFQRLMSLYKTSGTFVPTLLDYLSRIDTSCYEDMSQQTYSPLDVSAVGGGSSTECPAFTFSSSFCCRKIMDVTRAAKNCPAATSALLRTVSSLACSYIYFVSNMFLAPTENIALEDDHNLSMGMKSVVSLCKQHACASGTPNGFPKFHGQPCQMWRQSLAVKEQCHAVEQRTAALLSLPVVVSCYRRCVQCVAALLPAEDVQSHMELFDTLSTLSRWSITKDMRKLGQNLISPEEVANAMEKLKWDNANAATSGQTATRTIVTNLIQATCERLRAVFQYVSASSTKQGLNKAMREMFIACTAGLLEGIARVSKKTSHQQGREALMSLVQAVFKMMKGQLPSVSPKLLDTATKLASVAGETNAEVVKMFVQANQSCFSVRHLLLVAEGLDSGFMSRGKEKAEIQNMLANQFNRDDSVSALVLLDEMCSDWVQ